MSTSCGWVVICAAQVGEQGGSENRRLNSQRVWNYYCFSALFPAAGEPLAQAGREAGLQDHLVVVIQQAQRGSTVLVPIDTHHRLGGGRQGILQIRLPGFILAGVGSSGIEGRVTGHGH